MANFLNEVHRSRCVAALANGSEREVQMRKFHKRNQTQESLPVTPAAKQTKEILCFQRAGGGEGCSVRTHI